ncbi:MAG: argininosuccinate lyase [Brevinematales bacterium]|nr:argininosuccinate lyase [Brevinematales bacterium]
MAKVWDKGGAKLDPAIERYTVGNDFMLDRRLFRYELAASAAHAKMLATIGILTGSDRDSLLDEIKKLYKEHGGTIELQVSDEDIHSKLENLLTERLGDTGKKLHTGRSRNDQVLVVTRLYEKDEIIRIAGKLSAAMSALMGLARSEGDTVIPGYTHTRQAMPMTVGMWCAAFIESGADTLRMLKSAYDLCDRNPLGTASGYGVPLPLDREMTAELLGFAGVQDSPVYAQNSRGKIEAFIADVCWSAMHDLSRMASDLILWSMEELGYVSLGAEVTTGSSIMPQKRNPDALELIRARTNIVLACSTTIKTVVSGMISGYNRDVQETKEQVMRALDITSESLDAMVVLLGHIKFDPERIREGMTPGIFATDLAFAKVRGGMAFRDAYREAAKEIDSIEVNGELIKRSIAERNSPGSHVTIDWKRLEQETRADSAEWEKLREEIDSKFRALLG